MSIYFGLNSANYSSFFASGTTNKSSGIGVFGSLGDYGLIRSGSYKKLCKSYYEKQASSEDKTSFKGNKEIANEAGEVKKSVNELAKLDYTKENSAKVVSAVKNFVKSYNSMISSTTDSESASISNTSKYLVSNTKANASLLKQVGITVGSDNKLSVDTKALEDAEMSDLKTLFKGNGSYAGRVSSYATSIYMAAIASDSSLYSSSGSIQPINNSSLFNSYL